MSGSWSNKDTAGTREAARGGAAQAKEASRVGTESAVPPEQTGRLAATTPPAREPVEDPSPVTRG